MAVQFEPGESLYGRFLLTTLSAPISSMRAAFAC